MDALDDVRALMRGGRCTEAYRLLEGARLPAANRRAAQLLRVQLLEALGRHEESLALATSFAATRGLTDAERATCEYVLGRLSLEADGIDEAIQHFQRSIALAIDAHDLEQLAWSQIRLFQVVSERSGPQAAAMLVAQARHTTTRLGDATVSAALHGSVAQLEAQRGLLQSAARHVELAASLLAASPNLWIESMLETVRFGVGFYRKELDRVGPIIRRGLRLAEQSGSATMIRACLGSLGGLSIALGDLDQAELYLTRASAILPSKGDRSCQVLDALADMHLSRGRLDECARLLDVIDATNTERNRALTGRRLSQLTRARLMEEQGDLEGALGCLESALTLARTAGDQMLAQIALLRKADLLRRTGRTDEALDTLHRVETRLFTEWPDLYADYERILAAALGEGSGRPAAGRHYERARRIYTTLKSAPGLRELERSHASSPASSVTPAVAAGRGAESAVFSDAIHTMALMITLSSRPALLAGEVLEMLRETDCAEHASIVLVPSSGHDPEDALPASIPADRTAERRWWLGDEGGESVHVAFVARPDAASAATINALSLLLSQWRDARRAQTARDEGASLWPVDDSSFESGPFVANGHMRELHSFAKRIADTPVSVLITGESGTGKDVLARAIHANSSHPDKPFVPFNCAAVARELLESQLFGHRRGAFTGADRDFQGVIRSARGGTLFLDEIGELSLDLQPKILRFLESGEIAPLGESTPLAVPVRVIAATNASLEGLIKEGRFREDLFYRLNVVRFAIPPLRERRDEIPGLISYFLARSAEEFRKGRVRIADATRERLLQYAWPGNVRQLQNEIRRMVALAEENRVLVPSDIAPEILKVTRTPASPGTATGPGISVPLTDKLGPTLERIEREMVARAIREHDGRVDAAARSLGLSRKGFYLKRRRLGL